MNFFAMVEKFFKILNVVAIASIIYTWWEMALQMTSFESNLGWTKNNLLGIWDNKDRILQNSNSVEQLSS